MICDWPLDMICSFIINARLFSKMFQREGWRVGWREEGTNSKVTRSTT